MSGVQISLPRPIRQFATGFLFWPVLAGLLFEGTTFLRLALQSLAFSSNVEFSLADLSGARPRTVVTVAQLVEPWTVTPVVAGSNPVSHPIFLLFDNILVIQPSIGLPCSFYRAKRSKDLVRLTNWCRIAFATIMRP